MFVISTVVLRVSSSLTETQEKTVRGLVYPQRDIGLSLQIQLFLSNVLLCEQIMKM